MLRGLLFIEQPGVENGVERHAAVIAGQDARIRIERGDQFLDGRKLIRGHGARLTDASKGALLRIEARGLPPGWHGVHFHEKADCGDAAFQGAGGHVHSEKPIVHGFRVEGANDAGDLPNIHVQEDGSVTVELYSTLVSASGADGRPALKDADGSAPVIHANPDDYRTQPIGGRRRANRLCGHSIIIFVQ
ncbi:superoxide dismutase family protein [Novosphingobium naphthalenivorans]